MNEDFQFDVFLCHSSKDKPIVNDIAEQLKKAGLRLWYEEWMLKPGDSIPAKIEEGLERSRVLVLCLSENSIGSEWSQLESYSFRFRDPLNKERRFIPLRLDDAQANTSLAQFLFIDWRLPNRDHAYTKLLEVCQPPTRISMVEAKTAVEQIAQRVFKLKVNGVAIKSYAFSQDGTRVLTTSNENIVRLWDLETGNCLRSFGGDPSSITTNPWGTPVELCSVVWAEDSKHALSGSVDWTMRLWNLETGGCVKLMEGGEGRIQTVAISHDRAIVLAGTSRGTIEYWKFETATSRSLLTGHTDAVNCLSLAPDGHQAASGSQDKSVRVWDLKTKKSVNLLKGHTERVYSVAWSADQRYILSGSGDKTLRLWEPSRDCCIRILEGHTDRVICVVWNANLRHAISVSADDSIRLWDVEKGRCLCVFDLAVPAVGNALWVNNGKQAVFGDREGRIYLWDLSLFVGQESARTVDSVVRAVPDQVQYTNAKVLIVGESGVGKTGISKRLALNDWHPSDSTVGAWATQWKLPVALDDSMEREIWLWDFGGQADQRLIHQLYMDETALAVLVFDGQKDDLFETLGQWDRDLTRVSQKGFTKLLVAGRVDAGGLRASRSQLETFMKERGYLEFLETSAKTGLRCEELKAAILKSIRWDDIPWRSSPLLFKQLKEEIIKLKDAGRILMRFNELRESLQLRLSGDLTHFTDDELKAVVGLLSGPGVVWELKFGSLVLLQPGHINAYAQAVIQTMRADEHERGCLAEDRVLQGDLTYHRSEERLPADEERFVLLAMHKILVERGLCLREHTDAGTMLIFPSYYRRERPELVGHPAALVSYQFNGFLDEIYATLVVRLHHTKTFEQDQLWRYAADFKTLSGKQLGVKLERRAEGAGELVVYADPLIADAEKVIFSRYVHEHILQKGRDMVRLRHYCCQHCGTPVGNREVAMERLNSWLASERTQGGTAGKVKSASQKSKRPTILCVSCEQRVQLWDVLEQHFASDEVKGRVLQLQAESDLVLDNESKDRALVGDVISTTALAGQIIEEYSAKRYGLDMEIEFKDDQGKPTSQKLYLQLKSGDSHLRKRKDGTEIFQIHHEDHARYWMDQAYPVFLVIGSSEGEVRWMEIRDYLKRESDGGKTVRQIVFTGERFDVMSVRRWRQKVLTNS